MSDYTWMNNREIEAVYTNPLVDSHVHSLNRDLSSQASVASCRAGRSHGHRQGGDTRHLCACASSSSLVSPFDVRNDEKQH
jgi:hypothetical protein